MIRAVGQRAEQAEPVGGAWTELCRTVESMASRRLPGERRARVRAALPFGEDGITVLLESGTSEELARGIGDPHRPAALLETRTLPPARTASVAAHDATDDAKHGPKPAAAGFDVTLHFPEADPELVPLALLLAGGDGLPAFEGQRRGEATLRTYRPCRRAQVELRFVDGGATWFAKLERPERATRARRRRNVLARALTGSLRPPPEVAYDPAAGMTITAQASGTPLTDCLAGADGHVALARVGRALRELERLLAETPEAGESLPAYGFADAVTDLARFSNLLSRLEMPAAPLVAAGRQRLSAIAPDSRRRAVVHRDLHDQQVLLGDRVTLLDLDQASIGDPAIDLGNLLAHLRLRALQGRLGAACAGLQGALISGHAVAWCGAWRETVLTWEAASLLRLAVVYSLRPRWSHLGIELARSAIKLLDLIAAPGSSDCVPLLRERR
jgi:hypothetical protein